MEWLSILRVPEGEKNKEWYKKIFESLVPNSVINDDRHKRLLGIYGIINNDLTIIQQQLDEFCRPMGTLFDPFDINEKILAYNRIFPKFQYHLGQMLAYGSNFSVMRMGDEGNKMWNEELRNYLRQSVNERIQLRMEQARMAAQGYDDKQLEAFYARMRSFEEPENIDTTSFMSSSERFYSRMLQYFLFKYDLQGLKKKSFRHVLASDMMLAGIIHGTGDRPEPYVFNPPYVFHGKSTDEERIEKGPYWGYHMPITLAQAYDELVGIVSDKELAEFLKGYGVTPMRASQGNFSEIRIDFSKQQQLYNSQSNILSSDVGQHMDDQTQHDRGRTVIWKSYIEFKAWRHVLFVTTVNEYGKTVTEVVPDNFEIPKDATKVKVRSRYTGTMVTRHEWVDYFGNPAYAEYLYIPRRYEAVRYGNNLIARYREVPNQPISVDDPFDFELSAKGKYFTSVNASPISIVERALNVYFQYLTVKHLQNRELRKYEGIVKGIDAGMIPDYINQDENGNPIFEGVDKLAVWRYYRRKLGDSYFDSTMRTAGLSPQGSPGRPVVVESSDTIGQIVNMQQLLDLLDREMSIQMLVPPQAEGSFQPYSNASDNQMAVKAGSIIAESYYAEHNEVWRHIIKEYLSQIRNYYVRFFEEHPEIQETFLNYVAPNGAQEVLRITPDMLEHEDIGVFLKETYYARQYRDIISQRLQDIAQNQGQGVEVISELVMALARGDSPEDIHYRIQKVNKEQQARMQQLQQMQEQLAQQAKMEQMQLEQQNKLQDHALEKDIISHEYAKKTELASIGIWLGNAESQGSNDQDDIPGYIESLSAIRKMNREDEKMQLEKAKFEHQKTVDEKSLEKEDNAGK